MRRGSRKMKKRAGSPPKPLIFYVSTISTGKTRVVFMESFPDTIYFRKILDGEIYLGKVAKRLRKEGNTTFRFCMDTLKDDSLTYKYAIAKAVNKGDEPAVQSSKITYNGRLKVPAEVLKKVTLGDEKEVILIGNQDYSHFSILGKSRFDILRRKCEHVSYPKELREAFSDLSKFFKPPDAYIK